MTTVTLEALAKPLVAEHRTKASVQVDFDGFRVRIDTNSVALRDLLADYFREWVVPCEGEASTITALDVSAPELPVLLSDWVRDPGKVGRKDAFADIEGGRVVRKVRTGMQYLLGSGHRIIFGPCRQYPNQVINFIIAQHINHLMRTGLALCHAAGVVHEGRGLAIAGTSGAGKSSLALHLMSRGLQFASNDRLFVGRSHGEIILAGVAKQPRINPGTALSIDALDGVLPSERKEALSELEREELWDLEEKYDVDIGRVFGTGRWRLRAPVRAFLVLTWHHSERRRTEFRRADLRERRDLLEAIMKAPGPFFEPPGSDVPLGVYRMSAEEYLERLDGLPVYEATGRVDFELAANVCLRDYLAE